METVLLCLAGLFVILALVYFTLQHLELNRVLNNIQRLEARDEELWDELYRVVEAHKRECASWHQAAERRVA